MLPDVEDGTVHGTVQQKSYLAIFLAFHLMYWQAAGINPLRERVETGVMPITAENLAQFELF